MLYFANRRPNQAPSRCIVETVIDPDKQYYAQRHGRGPRSQPLPLDALRRIVFSAWDDLSRRDYFQEAFGYNCVDQGVVDGSVGQDVDAFFLRTLLRDNVWPYRANEPTYDADTLFDMIEVLHDLVSEPIPRPNGADYHSWSDCGWHYQNFNRAKGQEHYRAQINAALRLSDPGYQINELGVVAELAPAEFRQLVRAPVPEGTEHDLVTSKIDAAVSRFERRGASLDDRRHAVRDLADVLEALRPEIKTEMLSADEAALFNVANGFAVRHNNRQQKGDYDKIVLEFPRFRGHLSAWVERPGQGGSSAQVEAAVSRGVSP